MYTYTSENEKLCAKAKKVGDKTFLDFKTGNGFKFTPIHVSIVTCSITSTPIGNEGKKITGNVTVSIPQIFGLL